MKIIERFLIREIDLLGKIIERIKDEAFHDTYEMEKMSKKNYKRKSRHEFVL